MLTYSFNAALHSGEDSTNDGKVLPIGVSGSSHVSEDFAGSLSFFSEEWICNIWIHGSTEETNCSSQTITNDTGNYRFEGAAFKNTLNKFFFISLDLNWAHALGNYNILTVPGKVTCS
uniref:Uncharacterized protein n=1 Tax=Megaselia scalaris TaxID=36166 RepID=T1GBH2_MEGSC